MENCSHYPKSPIPKRLPVLDLANDIRPIAITCPVSKIAEQILAGVFDERFNEFVDECQFGSVYGRSTTLTLVKLAHVLYDASDDNCNIIRILFVDFSRAFDVTDHNEIADKLLSNNFPDRFSSWFYHFLVDARNLLRLE